jgi:hypothetical protein
MDVARFESVEAAQAACQGFSGHPGVKAFESMLDPGSVSMTHWSVARTW